MADAHCAVLEFGIRDEVRHSAPLRIWRHGKIFCRHVARRISVIRAVLLVNSGAGHRSYAWCEMAHLPPAYYSAEVFVKIFCRRVARDVINSVRSHPAEYSAAAEQPSKWGGTDDTDMHITLSPLLDRGGLARLRS